MTVTTPDRAAPTLDPEVELARTRRLLESIARAQALYFRDADPSELFGQLLDDLLALTESEYGYIAEVLHDDDGAPYLKTWAITDITWDEETRDLFRQHAVEGEGLEFRNLDTLFGWGLRDGGRVVLANETDDDPRAAGRPPGHPPLDCFLGIPVFRGTTLVGQLGVANRAGGYDDALVDALAPFAISIGNLIDVSRADRERREAEQRHAESEVRFAAIVEHLSDIVTVLAPDGSWVSSSPAATRLLEHPRGIDPPGGVFSLLHPDDQALAHRAFAEVLAGTRGPDEPVDVRVQAADGSYRILETVADDMRDNPAVRGVVLTSHDVTERRNAEQRLQERSAELTALVSHLGDGVLFVDADGSIVFANQVLCDLFGLAEPAEELVGRPVAAFVAPAATRVEDAEGFSARLGSRAAPGADHPRHLVPLTDGRVLECESTVVEREPAAPGHLWLLRDVTARTRLDAQRQAMLEREREMRLGMEEQNRSLRELDQLKNEFVATVSHELRTPLTSIVSFSQLLADDADSFSPEQREFLEILTRNAQRLLDIVGDLLLIAKLESGGIGVALEPTQLAGLVERSLDAFRAEAGAKDLDLVVRLDDHDAPAHVDPTRFDQVVANLVSNAVKFTPEGGSVTVTTQRRAGAWTVTVSDTGIGIPAPEIDRLFQRFYRGSNARLEELPGTGLGLAITRAIVDLHGGSLHVESEEGRGTTVTITVPDPDVTSVPAPRAGSAP